MYPTELKVFESIFVSGAGTTHACKHTNTHLTAITLTLDYPDLNFPDRDFPNKISGLAMAGHMPRQVWKLKLKSRPDMYAYCYLVVLSSYTLTLHL